MRSAAILERNRSATNGAGPISAGIQALVSSNHRSADSTPRGAAPELKRVPVFPHPLNGGANGSQIAIHRKLAVGDAHDPLEREADRIADRVMRMPDPAAIHSPTSAVPDTIQRKCSVSPAPQSEAAPPIVHDVLCSSGQPLDSTTRSFFEPRLGIDLSGVRTHTDSRAGQSAQAVNALAYTSGRDIVFRDGAYAPSTASGGRLLAHELAHVAQQTGATPTLQRQEKDDAGQGSKRGISVHTDCNEDQARMIAQAIVNARGMLRVAREWFISGDPNDPRLKALLRSHFRSDSDETRSAVHSKLTKVSTILEVAGDGRVLFNCVEASDPECLKHANSTDAYVIPGKGYRIYLCPRFFSKDVGSDTRTWVMIHEVCHVAGAMGDRYINDFGSTESGTCFGPDMFRDDPLNNADSYTSFVKCLVAQNMEFTRL
jgi:hypothetical protein